MVLEPFFVNPPASEASRDVANLIGRKNPHTPIYGVKVFVCLSVTNFNPNYISSLLNLRLGSQINRL